QDAVDEDRAAGLVDLVLDRLGVLRDFDDDVDFVRRVAAGGDEVQAHVVAPCLHAAQVAPGMLRKGEGRAFYPPAGGATTPARAAQTETATRGPPFPYRDYSLITAAAPSAGRRC